MEANGAPSDLTSLREGLLKQLESLETAVENKKTRLESARQFQQFVRDADQLESWVETKRRVVAEESKSAPQAQLKRLKALQEEVSANHATLEDLTQTANDLAEASHFDASIFSSRIESLEHLWGLLLEEISAKEASLVEKQKVSIFLRDIEDLEGWLERNMSVATSTEIGSNLEELEDIAGKFDEFLQEMKATDQRVATVNDRAAELLSEGHGDTEAISTRQKALNEKWQSLQTEAASRLSRISNAREVYTFFHDADDVSSRIKEKDTMLNISDVGTDLASVEVLQREHAVSVADLGVIESTIHRLSAEAERLADKFGNHAPALLNRKANLEAEWRSLKETAEARKLRLDDAYTFQKFMFEHRKLSSWLLEMQRLIVADVHSDDVSTTEALLQKNAEYKEELDTNSSPLDDLVEAGNRLIGQNHADSEDIYEKITALTTLREEVLAQWEQMRTSLVHLSKQQYFERDSSHLFDWIGSQNKALDANESEDSLEAVEALLKALDDFERSVVAQSSKFDQLAQFVDKLAAEEHPLRVKMKERHSELQSAHQALLDRLKHRRSHLEQLLQFFDFKRDHDETDAWITAKMKAASDESYLEETNLRAKFKNHQAFVEELAANASRVSNVGRKADALVQANHPKASSVNEHRQALDASWKVLRETADTKLDKLRQALQLHDFKRLVADFEAWCTQVEADVADSNVGSDLVSVLSLTKKHALLEAGIATQQERVDDLVRRADEMIQGNHFQATRVEQIKSDVVERYAALTVPSQQRRQALNASKEFFESIRLMEDEQAWIKDKDRALTTTNIGTSLIAVQNLQKKHQTMEAELEGRRQTVNDVLVQADNLIASNHPSKEAIKVQRDQLAAAWEALQAKCAQRSKHLDNSQKIQTYLSQASEAEAWLAEKEPVVTNANYGRDEDTALAMLKKHEAVVTELQAFKPKLDDLAQQSDDCASLTLPEPSSPESAGVSGMERRTSGTAVTGTEDLNLSARQAALEETYRRLLEAADLRSKKLTESQELLQFNREVDEVDSWMKTREAIAEQTEVGDDVEHNELIQKKFDEFYKDLLGNQTRVDVANQLADSLVAQGHSDSEVIMQRRQDLNSRWEALKSNAERRQMALSKAHDVHQFRREVAEVLNRLAEREPVLRSDDYGSDVASVETLQRRHNVAVRDLGALEKKVSGIQSTAEQLQRDQPDVDDVSDKNAAVQTKWLELQEASRQRQELLASSHELHSLFATHRELDGWLDGMLDLVSSTDLADDLTGAEELMKKHAEIEGEIRAHEEAFKEFDRAAAKAKASNSDRASEVDDLLQDVETKREQLGQGMEQRKEVLQQCADLHRFKRMADRASAWLGIRNKTLQAGETADSLHGVHALMKKHADFEKSLAAQKEKLADLDTEANRLIEGKHYAADDVKQTRDEVFALWQDVQQQSETKKVELSKALEYQQFNRDADEAEAWMGEKQIVAQDLSQLDGSNLEGNLQKHQAFEAELAANEGRITGVVGLGKSLIADGSPEAPAINERIKRLEEMWDSLHVHSNTKAQRLREAAAQKQFNEGVEDVEFWLTDTEAALASEDVGSDLPSVQNLLHRHGLLEADVAAKQERIDAVNRQADEFVAQGHFDADGISGRRDNIIGRYQTVQGRAKERGDQLQDSHRSQKVLRDLDDEEAWVRNKQRLAASTDWGRDPSGVQNLQKKHIALQGEIESHEPVIGEVLRKADEIASTSGSMEQASSLRERRSQLQTMWDELRSVAALRADKLAHALDYHVFAGDMEEEQSWIAEKLVLMSHVEKPDTLSGALALVKKHETFEVDLTEHEKKLDHLRRRGNELVGGGNFQADAIREGLEKLDTMFKELSSKFEAKGRALNDSHAYLKFVREADSITTWIEEKNTVASSQDFGKDLSAAQGLVGRHDTFLAAVNAFKPRVDEFLASLDMLKADKNSNTDSAAERAKLVQTKWDALLSNAKRRQENLQESLKLFQEIDSLFLQFAKEASQFNSWFENTEEDLSDPVRVNSLEEIENLCALHKETIQSLASAKAQLKSLEQLDGRIKSYTKNANPYTWFTMESLQESWKSLMAVVEERNRDLKVELKRQEDNEALRKEFARHANDFSSWLSKTRAALVDDSGPVKEQLVDKKAKHAEVVRRKVTLKAIEELGAKMEEALILDNKYTEHTTVGLAQQWDQLEQLGMRMQHNLEQLIQAQEMTGVTEEQLKDFNDTFKYFDKDKSGKLDHQELKSCLRTLGYNFSVVEDGQPDPEFDAVLAELDPSGDGFVSQSEFIAFMVSKVTENVESATEVIDAFKAAAGGKLYVTAQDLRRVLTDEQVKFCLRHMKPYVDGTGRSVTDAYDYTTFTRSLFK